ncbi:MAG TPA: flagellar basal body L-ring protein FlgH [Alphaproteobacteria bacterium]|nr:flagellar basal body L-ring protein FlgH [Alphaproteobacteria bacterium]
MRKLAYILPAALLVAGCQETLRPAMSPVGQQVSQNGTNLVAMPITMPPAPRPEPGSLWVPGSKQFFKDSRAHQMGDVVTVVVEENATASSSGKTSEARSHSQQAGILGIPWLNGKLLERGIPLGATDLANTTSDRSFSGSGNTNRTDTLTANIAAVVTQVMPNGLLVIQGQREVLVNYEKQKMVLSGIIRPEDISSANTIPSSKIAEARIAYSGDGSVDSNQTPQYGVRWLDKVLPF